MGNLIVHHEGERRRAEGVMLAAHMDEIGIVVTHVDQKGFLQVRRASAACARFPSAAARVRFSDGTVGVIGLEKLEDTAKIPPLEKYYHRRRRERAARTVRSRWVTSACFQRPCEELGTRMVAKAMDDRIGCAVLLQALRELRASPHDLSFVFTVQEEIGLRGAVTSGYGAEPELALAVDVTLTGDTPECPPMAVELGAGPAIKIKDSGMLTHVGVKEWLLATAERAGIPHQREVLVAGHHGCLRHPDHARGRACRLRLHPDALRAHALGNGGLPRRAGRGAAPGAGAVGTDRHREPLMDRDGTAPPGSLPRYAHLREHRGGKPDLGHHHGPARQHRVREPQVHHADRLQRAEKCWGGTRAS